MGKTAFLFAGQGAQAPGMGQSIAAVSKAARGVFEMGEAMLPGITRLCAEGPMERLTETENAQPALFLTDLACAAALCEAGITPDAVAGFSLGEIPALAFSGVLTEEDAFRLVLLRGKRMAACAGEHPGSMAAVLKMENADVEAICAHYHEVWPVNYNCPKQLSCAGSQGELDAFCNEIKAAGGRAVKLAVSGAFHTPYMKGASEALSALLHELPISAPSVPLYANLSGGLYPADAEGIADTVSRQASNPVRWETEVRAMAKAGVDTFLEVGVGKTLSGLVSRILPDACILQVTDAETLASALQALRA